MSTSENFINNDPLTAASWPTLDEVNPLDPHTTEIPVIADSQRRSAPKPPNIDEILDGSYTTGWIPIIVPGESLQTAEERALERIRRIEAQLDAEDYGIPIPAELAEPFVATSQQQPVARKKTQTSTRPQEPIGKPTHVVPIAESGPLSYVGDDDELLSPSQALDEARRRIQQMRNDLESNVEMVARSFEHPMFNPVALQDADSDNSASTAAVYDETEISEKNVIAENLNSTADSLQESEVNTAHQSTTHAPSTPLPQSGDELIVIHTNVDVDEDGPMTAPVDTAAVRQALDDVAQDVFIITNKTGPALNSDELLEALQNVAKRIEATTTLVDAASKFIDHKVEGQHKEDTESAKPSGSLFTHRVVPQDIPSDATVLSDLLAAPEEATTTSEIGDDKKLSESGDSTLGKIETQVKSKTAPKPGKGNRPPVKKQPMQQEPVELIVVGAKDEPEVSDAQQALTETQTSTDPVSTKSKDDNEELFLSDLISALDHMVETATDITKSTALDDVLSKYQHILDAPTGSIPVVDAAPQKSVPRLDISAMIAQIKEDAQSLLDEEVLESLRVEVSTPEELIEDAQKKSDSASEIPTESISSEIDSATKETPLIDALLEQLSEPNSQAHEVKEEGISQHDESIISTANSQPIDAESAKVEQEPTERELNASAHAAKVIQDIVDRLEAQQPSVPLAEGLGDALKPVDLPKIFQKDSPTDSGERKPQAQPEKTTIDSHEPDSQKAHEARAEFASQVPSATYVVSDQLPNDNSLELVIMRDEIRDLRDRLDASQKLIEDLMIRLANLTEIAIQGRQN